MPSPRILIQQQPRLIGRIVVAQQLLQRRFIEPFFVRHVVRFRLKRRDARWIRLVCARIHVAFFRRRLTTKPPDPRPARSCETAGFGLPADRKSASMPSPECQRLECRGLDAEAWPRLFECVSAGDRMKRSRRVILTMMGTATVGAVSMGFVPRIDCGPGRVPYRTRGPDGRLIQSCPATYGGFGGARFHGHGHGHGHGHAHGGG